MCSHICFLFTCFTYYDWMCNIVFKSLIKFSYHFQDWPSFCKASPIFSASPSNIIFCIPKSLSNSTTIYVAKASVIVGLIIYSLDEHLVATCKDLSLVIFNYSYTHLFFFFLFFFLFFFFNFLSITASQLILITL